jgi:hypothetical protein
MKRDEHEAFYRQPWPGFYGERPAREAFAAYRTVVSVRLMIDPATGRSRGFGFVTLSSGEEAQKALAAMFHCSEKEKSRRRTWVRLITDN